MAKRTISKIAIAPGKPVRVEDFRYVDQGLEWNMQEEYDLRDDHLQASRVINWEIFGEAALGLSGWAPGDSLLLYVTGVELFATEGLCYIGGRSYVLTANTELFDGETPATNTYNIYLKYTLASDEFAYEYTTSTRTDDHLIKYLLIGTALYTSAVGWSNPIDKRASNTALGAPATVSGSDAGPIFTVENTGAGLGLLVKQSDAQIGEDGTPQILTIWGTGTTGLTLKKSGTANLVTLSCDATGRMKVTGSINVTATGSTIASSATVGGVVLNVGAVSSVTTLGMSGQLTNTLAIGTAPFVITSTDVVDNLNVDKWDSYDLNLVGAADNEIVIFDYSNSTLKTANYVIGNASGNVPVSNGTTCVNLKAANAVNAEDSDKWDGYQFADYLDQAVKQASTPTFASMTVGVAGITFDSTGVDPVISAKAAGGELYFGDTTKLADKESSPSWSITGAGIGTFASLSTSGTINGLTVSAGTISGGTWQASVIANAYVADDITLTNITQITNRAHASLSGVGTKTHTTIDSHIDATNIHFTQSGITTVGTVGSGIWHGSAITNAYLASFGTSAQLDQDCRTSSDPLFGTIRVDDAATASGIDNRVTIGRHSDGIRIYEPSAGSLGGAAFEIYTQAAVPSGYRMGTVGAYNIYVETNFHPVAGNTHALGTTTYYWSYVYSHFFKFKESPSSFDHIDDLAIIDTMSTTKEGKVDMTHMPKEIYDDDGFFDLSNYQGFLTGSIKQLHNKVKEQERVIDFLIEKTEELEKRISAS